MKVYSFFRAVAEGVAAQGIRQLAEELPGGKYFSRLAEFVLTRYRQLRQQAAFRDEMREMVSDEFAAQQQSAKAAVDAVATADTPLEDRISLELFLAQIPAVARKTFARPEDPSGRTVPPAFDLNTPDDVLKMLPPAPPKLRPGMPLPGRAGWVVDSLIGTGGFGEVWFARHTRMTALTGALKVCPARRATDLHHEGDLINRVMAAGEHPNVVRLLDADLDGDPPWLLFEHVAGGDLAGWVHELHAKPPETRVTEVVAALTQLASAVGHFHRMTPAVVHRDLKPANILVDKANRRLRITDFGIGAVSSKDALEAEVRGTATRGGRLQSSLRGSHTPLYASPQQRDGADPDPRDDIHALGVIAYQMLTGDLNRGAGADLPDDLREAGAPEPLVELIAKCVAQKPDRRPRDGDDLAARLAAVTAPAPLSLDDEAGGAVPSRPVARLLRRERRQLRREERRGLPPDEGDEAELPVEPRPPKPAPPPVPPEVATKNADAPPPPAQPAPRRVSTKGTRIVVVVTLIAILLAVAAYALLSAGAKSRADPEQIRDTSTQPTATPDVKPPPKKGGGYPY